MIGGERESLVLGHFAPEMVFLVLDATMVTDLFNLHIFWAAYFRL